MDHYNPYLVTFTFKDRHSKLPMQVYQEYFKYFYGKLNQHSINNRRDHSTDAIMILLPEKSEKEVKGNMFAANHYHGFVMVHHANLTRFENKCLMHLDKVNRTTFSYKLLNPYPRKIQNSNTLMLEHYSFDVENPRTNGRGDELKQIADYSHYSMKNFSSSEFTIDDMLIYNYKTF
jgi:gamma-glutamylcyclotransferase (GGCT)/AIG2-like uncharacterized protein YtfP